ncbi:hypothetical protein CASFOL_021240 [Castilleja foliolosa]|uniref:Uncharacterized protein n=1 Tax=Castilleja foliolosa TaxID=1961234 RepID=A0ABD3CXY5_9LAMI
MSLRLVAYICMDLNLSVRRLASKLMLLLHCMYVHSMIIDC